MRQPCSWDDADLLQDEPFSSVFPACAEILRSCHEAEFDVDRVLDTLAEGFRTKQGKQGDAAAAWIRLAFPPEPPHNRGSQKRKPQNVDHFRSFVDFYWKTFQGDEPDTYLSRQRKRTGYKGELPPPIPKIIAKDNMRGYHNDAAVSVEFSSNSGDSESFARWKFQGHSRIPRKCYGATKEPGLERTQEKKEVNTLQVGGRSPCLGTSQCGSLVKETSPRSLDVTVDILDTTQKSTTADRFPLSVQCLQNHPSITPVDAGTFSTPLLEPGTQNGRPPLETSGSDCLQNVCAEIPLVRPEATVCIPQDPSATAIKYNTTPHPDWPSPDICGHNTTMRSAPAIKNTMVESAKRERRRSGEIIMPSIIQRITGQDPTDGLNFWARSNVGPIKHEFTDNVNLNPSFFEPQTPSGKPPLPRFPPIWAQSRQEVCESFDWFRSYQGGVYFCNNIVKGYLLSAFSSRRDVFEHGGKLIISHGGGGAESVHHRHGQGINEAAVDQHARDKSVRALLQNYKETRPLVLLIDDKYVLFPFDLESKNVAYAVLGFYTITHTWAEYQPANNVEGRVVRYKFAFEWCQGQGEPWWYPNVKCDSARPFQYHPEGPPIPNRKKFPVKVDEYKFSTLGPPKSDNVYMTCETCQVKIPQVYQPQWICLNRACARFWVTRDGTNPSQLLEYNPDFLRLSSLFVLPTSLVDILPAFPVPSINSVTTTHAFTRGWYCHDCGRLSCRYKWEEWECSHCKKTTKVFGKLHAPSDFKALNLPSTSYYYHSIAENSGIIKETLKIFPLAKGKGQTQTFVLPDGKGRIHHIQTGNWNSEEVDEIFKNYQEQATSGKLLLRRWPLRSHKCRGTLLTNYFSQNTGEPYQYVGGTANTVAFSEAPGAVLQARDFIQARIQEALEIDLSFNEVLSAAYIEGQKMAFHSDAEPGLGPIVAGLSLGSSALIHFRPHSAFKIRPVVISFVLRHGDVLVMDGADVQRHYEHTVVPTGFRIAATARNIHSSHA